MHQDGHQDATRVGGRLLDACQEHNVQKEQRDAEADEDAAGRQSSQGTRKKDGTLFILNLAPQIH